MSRAFKTQTYTPVMSLSGAFFSCLKSPCISVYSKL